MADEKTGLLASNRYEKTAFAKVMEVENRVKSYYIRGMRFLRAREFMAEFLATFLLVVRCISDHVVFCTVGLC